MGIKKLLNKKKYYAAGFRKYMKKWGDNDVDIKKQLGFYYRYWGVFFEDGKWKTVFKQPVLFSGVLFMKFLIGIVYLMSKFKKK